MWKPCQYKSNNKNEEYLFFEYWERASKNNLIYSDSNFDEKFEQEKSKIVIADHWNEVLSYLKDNPALLLNFDPREFEKLINELINKLIYIC